MSLFKNDGVAVEKNGCSCRNEPEVMGWDGAGDIQLGKRLTTCTPVPHQREIYLLPRMRSALHTNMHDQIKSVVSQETALNEHPDGMGGRWDCIHLSIRVTNALACA